MKHTLTLFLLFASASFFTAFSQTWTNLQQWGGTGTEICGGLAIDSDGAIFLAGSFENQITFGNQTLTAIGEEDIFICKLAPDGTIIWAKRAGSRLEDEVTDLALDADNNLVVIGTYWLEGDFDNIKLTAGANPKAIFVAKYNSDGQVQWARSGNGAGLKGVEALIIDSMNNIFITGYFEKNFQIGDTSLSANGTTDLLLAKFSSDGQLRWAVHQGKMGDTRGTALSLATNGDAIVAGYFNGITQIADTLLTANTLDQDAFIARFDKNGIPLWAKKAGGVFDSDVTGLVVDEADHIYLTGYFVGTMRLSPALSIQSSNGNSDFFLLKYDINGTPLLARALGGLKLDQALDIAIQNNILLLSGFYQGDLTLDRFSFSTGNTISGFVAGFDTNLQCQWAKNLASNEALYTSRIAVSSDGNIAVAGSFIGKATLDVLEVRSENDFNLFLASMRNNATDVTETSKEALFRVFPNPTTGKVFIQTTEPHFSLQIFNNAGQTVFTGKQLREIDFSSFPKGTYILSFQGNFISQTFKIIWN